MEITQDAVHYCSVISKANGEDPIGSAGTADQWLLVEVAKPWSAKLWRDSPRLKEIFALLKSLEQQGVAMPTLRVLAIAPDPDYSDGDRPRIFFYRRPQRLFSCFEKQEYQLPSDQVIKLVTALITTPEQLHPFERYRQETTSIRELLVCTHGDIDAACGQFGTPIYNTLRNRLSPDDFLAPARIWQVCHFGGHKFAPTLIDFPHGHFWGHLEPAVLETLIHRQGSVEPLRPYYRGWAGLGQFEQIVEREVWMQEGWAWLDYAKTGKVVAKAAGEPAGWQALLQRLPINRFQHLGKRSPHPQWVDVEIEFVSVVGDRTGVYEARVLVNGEVMTTPKSAKKVTLKAVPQYHVQYCRLV